MEDESRSSTWILAARAMVILVFASWVWVGPFRGQHLKDKAFPSWSWALFRHGAKHTCDVAYYERVDGEDIYVERAPLFGYDAPHLLPRRLRVIEKSGLPAIERQMCTKLRELRGTPVDLRGEVRCAINAGWKTIEAKEHNLCEPKPKKPKKKKKKAKKTKGTGK